MTTALIHRALSLSLSAIVTVALLAGVDALATQQPSAALLAQSVAAARA